MTNTELRVAEFEGLLPALDARQVSKPFVLDGRNFVFTTEGPVSGFGVTFTTYIPFDDPEFVASFRIDDRVFVFTSVGVYEFDSISSSYVLLFPYNIAGIRAKWSHALVGAKHYFSHLGLANVIVYTPAIQQWKLYTGANLTSGARYVTETAGRLIILGSSFVQWSALDDGEDVTPSIVTGAGGQSTALVGGETFVVEDYGDGFITYTANGTMVSAFIGGAQVFRSRPMQGKTQYQPFNRFSVVVVRGLQIMLTEQGLFQTQGAGWTSWDPIFSEFLKDTQLPLLGSSPIEGAVSLFYNPGDLRLFISFSFSTDAMYDYAYVRQITIPKWGRLDQLHHGFAELQIAEGPDAGIAFGFICDGGYARTFSGGTFIEIPPITDNVRAHFYRKTAQFPVHEQGNISVMPSIGRLTAVDETDFRIQLRNTGWYKNIDFSGSPNLAELEKNTIPLQSFVDLGLFRLLRGEYSSEVAMITGVAIGAGFTPLDQTVEDWNIDTGEEDWNLLSGEEDWGKDIPNAQFFSSRISSSNDGLNIEEQQLLEISVEAGAQNYYKPSIVGAFHLVQVSALQANEFYHVKYVALDGNSAGNL